MDTGEGDALLDVSDSMASFKSQFQSLVAEDQLGVLSELLADHATTFYEVTVPDVFLQLSLMSMKHLDSSGKMNVLYELAKGLGTLRPNSSEPVFPMSRMPFGLLQYMVTFFTCKPGQHVSTAVHYMQITHCELIAIVSFHY